MSLQKRPERVIEKQSLRNKKAGGLMLNPPACCQFACDRRYIAGIAGVSVMRMILEAVE
jgi:hypothetical protein